MAFQITINVDDNWNLTSVGGFPTHKVLALGVMNAAILGIIKTLDEQNDRLVQPATGPLPPGAVFGK